MSCMNCINYDIGAGFEFSCELGFSKNTVALKCPHYLPIDVGNDNLSDRYLSNNKNQLKEVSHEVDSNK